MFTEKQLKTISRINKGTQKRFKKKKPKFEDWYRCRLCAMPYYEMSPFHGDELDNYITVTNKKEGSWYYLHVACHERMLSLALTPKGDEDVHSLG